MSIYTADGSNNNHNNGSNNDRSLDCADNPFDCNKMERESFAQTSGGAETSGSSGGGAEASRIAEGGGAPESETASSSDDYAPAQENIPTDNSPKSRIEAWQRNLLDFSTRSPLMNVKISSRCVQILHPGIEELENGLFKGEKYCLIPNPFSGTEPDFRNDSLTSGDNGDFLLRLFKNKKIAVSENEKELQRKLVQISRKAQADVSETGVNTMYLACGMIEWTDSKNASYLAPVLLYPVSLKRRSTAVFELSLRDDEDAELNYSIFEKFRNEFNYQTRLDYENLPRDDYGLDIKRIFTIIREELARIPNWRFLEACALGLFSFDQFVMWSDLRKKSEELANNKIVASLIKGRVTFTQEPLPEVSDDDFTQEVLPVSLDESQLQAVKAAARGYNFILQGPPGTGKSQTITGMIVNSIVQGKKVLFAAEKMAALQVVYRNLKKVNLSDYILELHSTKTTKSHLTSQLRTVLEREYRNTCDNSANKALIEKDNAYLSRYVDIVNGKTDCGMSLFGLVNAYEDYKNIPTIDLRYQDVRFETEEGLNEFYNHLKEYARSIQKFRPVRESPYRFLKLTRFDDEGELSAGTELKAIADSLHSLKTQLREFLTDSENERNGEPVPDFKAGIGENISYSELSVLVSFYEAIQTLKSRNASSEILSLSEEEIGKEFALIESYQNVKKEKLSYGEAFWQSSALQLDVPSLLRTWDEVKKGIFKKRKRDDFISHVRSYVLKGRIIEDNVEKEMRRLAEYISARAEADAIRESLTAAFYPYAESDNEELTSLKNDLLVVRNAGKKVLSLCSRASDEGEIQSFCEKNYRDADRLGSIAGIIRRIFADFERLSVVLNIDSSFYNESLSEVERIASDYKDNLFLIYDKAYCNEQRAWFSGKKYAEPFLEMMLNGDALPEIFTVLKASYYKAQINAVIRSGRELERYGSDDFETLVSELAKAEDDYRRLVVQSIPLRIREYYEKKRANAGSGFDLQENLVRRFITRGGKGIPIRALFSECADYITDLCPCVLMSPLSAAQYLEPGKKIFDLVIFDEASQIQTCKAVGAIARGENLVIVGDSKQMPPTNFFKKAFVSDDEDEFSLESEKMKDLESILDDAEVLGLPTSTLSWHYRSKSESLIHFSNKQYYNHRLKTYPSTDSSLSKVVLRRVQGYYEAKAKEPNPYEAEAIVEEIRKRLGNPETSRDSIGVITFSEKQQNAIIRRLDDLFERNAKLAALAHWYENEIDCEDKLIVKNLENIQGDERDVIILSVTFGKNKEGNFVRNFGPINKEGGEKRLNVAFSRAKKLMEVFTIIDVSDFNTESLSRGAKDLKEFLLYAKNGERTDGSVNNNEESVKREIARCLRNEGFECAFNVGLSDFKIDIALSLPEDRNTYFCGVMLDGETLTSSFLTNDRFVLRRSVLQSRGWNLLRVRTIDWYRDKDGVLQALLSEVKTLYGKACEERERKEREEKERKAKEAEDAAGRDIEKGGYGADYNGSAGIKDASDSSEMSDASSASSANGDLNASDVVFTAYAGAYEACDLDLTPIESAKLVLQDKSVFESRFRKVLEKEGPIVADLLEKRVLQSFGVKKRGKNIKPFLDGILDGMDLLHTEEESADGERVFVFWQEKYKVWGENVEDRYIQYRSNPQDSKEDGRSVSEIPGIEIRNAMIAAIKEKGGFLRDSLVVETAEKLGFKRKGAAIIQILNSVFERAVQSGKITENKATGEIGIGE